MFAVLHLPFLRIVVELMLIFWKLHCSFASLSVLKSIWTAISWVLWTWPKASLIIQGFHKTPTSCSNNLQIYRFWKVLHIPNRNAVLNQPTWLGALVCAFLPPCGSWRWMFSVRPVGGALEQGQGFWSCLRLWELGMYIHSCVAAFALDVGQLPLSLFCLL